jgi:hypothetical protein
MILIRIVIKLAQKRDNSKTANPCERGRSYLSVADIKKKLDMYTRFPLPMDGIIRLMKPTINKALKKLFLLKSPHKTQTKIEIANKDIKTKNVYIVIFFAI